MTLTWTQWSYCRYITANSGVGPPSDQVLLDEEEVSSCSDHNSASCDVFGKDQNVRHKDINSLAGTLQPHSHTFWESARLILCLEYPCWAYLVSLTSSWLHVACRDWSLKRLRSICCIDPTSDPELELLSSMPESLLSPTSSGCSHPELESDEEPSELPDLRVQFFLLVWWCWKGSG